MKLALALLILLLSAPAALAQDAAKESTYDRVNRSNTIRCGYTLYSVALYKDLKTGELKGIYKDVMDSLGEKLGLKIEWAEEVGWGQQIEGLNTGRYDMVCSPANITGPRARNADLTDTLYFEPVWIWVRGDDKRFDNAGRAALNKPEIKVAAIDGEQSEAAAKFYLPKATLASAPQASDYSIMLMDVATKKADVTFASPITVKDFQKTNKEISLRQIEGDQPLYLAVAIMQIKRGEHDFKAMINNELRDLFASGIIDMILDRHEPYKNSFLRVATPYAPEK